jgi:hypothetical protein
LINLSVSDTARLDEYFDHTGRGVSNIQPHPLVVDLVVLLATKKKKG